MIIVINATISIKEEFEEIIKQVAELKKERICECTLNPEFNSYFSKVMYKISSAWNR